MKGVIWVNRRCYTEWMAALNTCPDHGAVIRGLEDFYRRYNRREFVHPDPLEFLYRYKNAGDREVVGLIAASFAYGNVKAILSCVQKILGPMGASPREFIISVNDRAMGKLYPGFKYRFTGESDLLAFIAGIRRALKEYGTLQECMLAGCRPEDETVAPAIRHFIERVFGANRPKTLIPDPDAKSAFKRLNLYFRWMARKDNVDPGGWSSVSPSKLIIPLDTHMHKMSMELGLTKRKQAGMKTALEITGVFAAFCPEDPVRYDFAITRPGIQKNQELFRQLRKCVAG